MKRSFAFISFLIVIGMIIEACVIFSPSKPAPSPTVEVPLISNSAATSPQAPPPAPTKPVPSAKFTMAALPTVESLPTEESMPTLEPSPSVAAEPCFVVARSEITIYMRPSKSAMVFSEISGPIGRMDGKTEDGWLGFDPGVPQAVNVGVFRYRWIPPDADIETTGNCDALPVVWGPPPGVCFAMLMPDAKIYQLPDESSPVITTVVYGQYAEVIGRHGDDWLKLDLSVGNIGLDAEGWIELSNMSYNGECADLPEMEH